MKNYALCIMHYALIINHCHNIKTALHTSLAMGARLLVLAGTLWLASCGVPNGQVRISGEYKGQQQADFLIISTDGGLDRIDTLHIVREQFDYQTDLTKDATFNIIYPGNALSLTLWAHSGEHIRIEGSKDDLWHVEVKGNKENELYTEFRQQCEATDTITLRNTAARFIREHADSPVATYLLTQYFIIPNNLPSDSISKLYKVLLAAQPEVPQVISLGGQIKQMTIATKGKRMPDFELTTLDSVRHTLKDYRGSTLILYFWAGWQGYSKTLHKDLAEAKMEAPSLLGHEVELLSYSLDIDSATLSVNRNDELLPIPTYCDYLGFESPYAKHIGINHLPMVFVIDPRGRIEYTSRNTADVRKYLSGNSK